jgi:hypothetical protein
MVALLLASASLALAASLSTPALTVRMSGVTLTVPLPVTVMVRLGGVWSASAKDGAREREIEATSRRKKCLGAGDMGAIQKLQLAARIAPGRSKRKLTSGNSRDGQTLDRATVLIDGLER